MGDTTVQWSMASLRLGLSGWRRQAILLTVMVIGYLLLLELSITQALAGLSWWGIATQPATGGTWAVTWVEPNGLAWDGGLRPGDLVVAVDGVPPTGQEQINAAAALGVRSPSSSYERTVERPAFTGSARLEALIDGAVSLFFVLAGSLVYLRANPRRQARAFVLPCVAATLTFVAVPAGTLGQPWAVRLTFVAALVVPTTFAIFFLVFPVERARRSALSTVLVGALALPLAIALCLYLAALAGHPDLFAWAQRASYANNVLGYGSGLGLLLNSYFGHCTPRARQRLRIAVGGTVLGILPFLTLTVLPQALAVSLHSPPGAGEYAVAPGITVLGTVFIPLSFGYAILKHQLIDADVTIRRGIVYASIILAMTACYLLTISVFQAVYALATGQTSFVTLVVSALIVAMVAEPIRRVTQSWVERTFFSDIYTYRQLLGEVGGLPDTILSPEKLMPLMVGMITAALPVDRVALLVADRSGGGYRVRWDNRGPRSDDVALDLEHPLLRRFERGAGASILEAPILLSRRPDPRVSAAAGTQLGVEDPADARWLYARVLSPLRTGGHVVAVLALGERSDGELYSGTDLEFLNSASARYAVALENALLHETVRHQADTDALTGIHNHRSLLVRLGAEVEAARRLRRPLAVLMMDVDSFKFYNDTYGHPAGDRVLVAVTRVLQAAIRPGDVLGRYGGDEFVCVLPNTGRDDARQLAERINHAAQQVVFRGHGAAISLSLTIGAAAMPADGETPVQLIAAADVAMYGRKRAAFAATGAAAGAGAHAASGTLPDVSQVQSAYLRALIAAVEIKEGYAVAHSERTAHWAVQLAAALGLSSHDQQVLRIAGLLHDIGKLGIPERILNKVGLLTPDERKLIEQHVEVGVHLITDVPFQDEVVEAVANHHERWDGRGHPRGALGTAIPLGGRILALADVYAALTTDRPYRPRLTHAEALQRLRDGAGGQFDPDLVAVFAGIVPAGTGDGTPPTGEAAAWPPPWQLTLEPPTEPVESVEPAAKDRSV